MNYESGTYGSKLLKIVQMHGEKVVAGYDPHRMGDGGGSSTPTAFSKVGNYVNSRVWGSPFILVQIQRDNLEEGFTMDFLYSNFLSDLLKTCTVPICSHTYVHLR